MVEALPSRVYRFSISSGISKALVRSQSNVMTIQDRFFGAVKHQPSIDSHMHAIGLVDPEGTTVRTSYVGRKELLSICICVCVCVCIRVYVCESLCKKFQSKIAAE